MFVLLSHSCITLRAHSREKPIQDAPSRMSPRIAPMHVHCEFTTVECREPLLELCSGDNGSRLLNIEVKCSHLRAKTGRISGHLPTEHVVNFPEGSTESPPLIKFCLEV